MASCKECGNKLHEIEVSSGVCYDCQQKRAAIAKRERIRENLEACKAGKAKPNVQRIYDAFVAEYPGALLTGIIVKDDGNMLLLYLDGKPAYFATMNVLTGKAELEAYDAPVSSTSQNKSGCMTTCLIVLAVFLVLVYALNQQTPSNKASSPTVTAAPTATASADDLVSWATYYVIKALPDDMTLDTVDTSVSVGENYLSIACNMAVMHDSDDYLRAASELIISSAPKLRELSGYDHVTYIFYGPFVDKHGNETQALAIRAMYSFDTLQKLNTSYFRDRRYSDPDGIIKAADNYMIHRLYQD